MASPAPPLPIIATRGSNGVTLYQGSDGFKEMETLVSINVGSKVFAFSPDGNYFAYCDGQRVKVLDLSCGDTIFNVDKAKTTEIVFSPQSTYIALYNPFFTTPANKEGDDNFQIYDLKSRTPDGEHLQLRSLKFRNLSGWEPHWPDDDSICALRVATNEVQFYPANNLSGKAPVKLYLEGVTDIAISRGCSPFHMAVYVQGKKGNPSFVRLFEYPEFTKQIANKSIFKSDKVDLMWNKKGNAVLILCSVEIDTTGSSYYGEQTLHHMTTRGDTTMVQLEKRGPVYSVDWNSNSTQFAVVYGYMPAKATLFNSKCEAIYDYGTGPRNHCKFNPHGNILCLAGTGNLRGNFEMWNVQGQKLLTKMTIDDITHFEWCATGEHLLLATLAPRLKVGNGFAVRRVLGSDHTDNAYKFDCAKGQELLAVAWQPQADDRFPTPKLTNQQFQAAKVAAYRPPSARSGPEAVISSLSEGKYEAAANQKAPEQLSAAALKNKRKREAKAKAKQEQEENPASSAVTAAPATVSSASAEPVPTGDPDIDKKIRALRKKLKQIEELKQKKKAGQVLEQNQLDKLKCEQEVLTEMQALQI